MPVGPHSRKTVHVFLLIKRISGEFFLLFSGAGGGSFGRRRNFLVTAGLLSKISETQDKCDRKYLSCKKWCHAFSNF